MKVKLKKILNITDLVSYDNRVRFARSIWIVSYVLAVLSLFILSLFVWRQTSSLMVTDVSVDTQQVITKNSSTKKKKKEKRITAQSLQRKINELNDLLNK